MDSPNEQMNAGGPGFGDLDIANNFKLSSCGAERWQIMKAVVVHKYGGPEELKFEELMFIKIDSVAEAYASPTRCQGTHLFQSSGP